MIVGYLPAKNPFSTTWKSHKLSCPWASLCDQVLPSSTPTEFARLGSELLPLLVTLAADRKPADSLQARVFSKLACVDLVGRVILLLLEDFHDHHSSEDGAEVVARHLAAMCTMVQESLQCVDDVALAQSLEPIGEDKLCLQDQHAVAREMELHCLRVVVGVLQRGQICSWAEQVRVLFRSGLWLLPRGSERCCLELLPNV